MIGANTEMSHWRQLKQAANSIASASTPVTVQQKIHSLYVVVLTPVNVEKCTACAEVCGASFPLGRGGVCADVGAQEFRETRIYAAQGFRDAYLSTDLFP